MPSQTASSVWAEVDALGQDLVYCAKTYGKIIISEIGLPVVSSSTLCIDSARLTVVSGTEGRHAPCCTFNVHGAYDSQTIKPLTDTLGGVAGGQKFVRILALLSIPGRRLCRPQIAANLLFKFAVDSAGLFQGDDNCAAKVAAADLRSASVPCSLALAEMLGRRARVLDQHRGLGALLPHDGWYHGVG